MTILEKSGKEKRSKNRNRNRNINKNRTKTRRFPCKWCLPLEAVEFHQNKKKKFLEKKIKSVLSKEHRKKKTTTNIHTTKPTNKQTNKQMKVFQLKNS